MESSTQGRKKRWPVDLTIVRAFHPPGSLLTETVDELPNESTIYLQSIHYPLVGENTVSVWRPQPHATNQWKKEKDYMVKTKRRRSGYQEILGSALKIRQSHTIKHRIMKLNFWERMRINFFISQCDQNFKGKYAMISGRKWKHSILRRNHCHKHRKKLLGRAMLQTYENIISVQLQILLAPLTTEIRSWMHRGLSQVIMMLLMNMSCRELWEDWKIMMEFHKFACEQLLT